MLNSNKLNPSLIQKDQNTSSLDLSKYTRHIKEFLRPTPLIYWSDFLLSNFLGNLFIFFSMKLETFTALQLLCMAIAIIFLYRAAVFVHEDLHFGRKIKGFSLAYNLIFGFLHKLPSYTYSPHLEHHLEKSYGTSNDPEYDTLADKPKFSLLLPFFTLLFVPGFLILRYGFFPLLLPFIGKKARMWIYTHVSTFKLNYKYQRRSPSPKEEKIWYLQDLGCFIYNTLFFTLLIAQILPWKLFWIWYFVMYGLYTLNFYRVIISHTYLTGFQTTTYKQQVLDSTTLPSPLSEWWCPIGLRYHALHHMYPSIPYHNLGKAHKRLLQYLPLDHPYRHTLIKGYYETIKSLIKRSDTVNPRASAIKENQ